MPNWRPHRVDRLQRFGVGVSVGEHGDGGAGGEDAQVVALAEHLLRRVFQVRHFGDGRRVLDHPVNGACGNRTPIKNPRNRRISTWKGFAFDASSLRVDNVHS